MNKKRRKGLLTILFILICFQNLKIATFGGIAIKPYHLLAIILVPLLFRKKIYFLSKWLNVFMAIIVTISVLESYKYGINSLIVNYFFSFLLMLIVINVGSDFSADDWISMLRIIASIMMIAIWVKNISQITRIISFFQKPYGHPLVSTFLGGGVNLEATYMAMLIPVFKNDKKMPIYHLASILLSVIYVSRAALVVNLIVLFWFGCNYIDKKYWSKIAIGIGVLFIFIFVLYKSGKADYLILRLSHFGQEAGVVGRLRMWNYFTASLSNNPFGVGIGNSIKAIKEISKLAYTEDNMHNLYMQMFVDLGIIGGAYYIILIFRFIVLNRNKLLLDPIVFIIFTYIIVSSIQFRGAEAFIYYFLGIYFQEKINHKQKENKI